MAARKTIHSKAGTTRTKSSVQVPLNTQDLAAALEQLQESLNEAITRLNALVTDFNAHTHSGVTVGAGATGAKVSGAVTAVTGTAVTDTSLFTP